MSAATLPYPHGTITGYTNHRCRCTPCTEAQRQYQISWRSRAAAELAADDPRHGRASTYTNLGCRCDGCRAARAEYMRQRRALR